MTDLGLTERQLCLKAEIDPGYISRLRGRMRAGKANPPKLPTLTKLARPLNVDPEWLAHGDSADQGMAAVTVYDVQAAAGDGALIVDETEAGKVSFSKPWLRSLTTASPDKLSIIQAYGDSMEPTIPESAWVMVDTTQKEPINRQIYVFRHGDDARVKRFLIHPTTGALTIRSDNPAWEDIEIPSIADINIIGRVIWMSKKMV